jgi:trimethylamine corrinoid protein
VRDSACATEYFVLLQHPQPYKRRSCLYSAGSERLSVDTAIKELKDVFYAQDDVKSGELTRKALEAGVDPQELLEKHLLEWTKDITGRSIFDSCREVDGKAVTTSENAVMLSELVFIAECLKAAVAVIRPELEKSMRKVEVPGKIVIGTVEGDVHDIGKSLVASMLESAGYTVTDLGFDVPAKTFVLQAKFNKADIIGLSCSMAMSRTVMKEVVNELKKLGIRNNVKVITGGQASFDTDIQNYGTDAFGASISAAMSQSNEMMRILKEERAKNKS